MAGQLSLNSSLSLPLVIPKAASALVWIYLAILASWLPAIHEIFAFGAADLKGNQLVNDGENVFNIQFIAKKPQDEWGSAAIWTGPKYVGGNDARDMNITPAMGVIEVRRINKPIKLNDIENILVFPNPTDGEVMVQFRVDQESETEVIVSDLVGRKVMDVINTKMPAGEYKYVVNLTKLNDGFYLMSVKTDTKISTSKIIISK
jgi:hypothetical protein